MTDQKEFWITNSRFKYIGLILLIIFIVFISFLFLKADEITKDPCSICSENMGQEVRCVAQGTILTQRTYFPNGSIINDVV